MEVSFYGKFFLFGKEYVFTVLDKKATLSVNYQQTSILKSLIFTLNNSKEYILLDTKGKVLTDYYD
jgi:hypothetical protein